MPEPTPLTRALLRSRGVSDDRITYAIRNGRLAPLARGLYLRRADYDALDAVGHHRVRARHEGSRLEPGHALSHVSAALLHGVDVWDVDLRRVHVSGSKGRVTEILHRHETQFSDGDVVDIGVPVTSIERTIVDLGRSLPFEQAVVAGDAALRLDPSARDRLPGAVAAASWAHGAAAARAVASFIDGRSESVGESRSRVRIAECGLPAPILQQAVQARNGCTYRLDFFWRDSGVIGEFDGLGKYDDRRDLVAEKRREDALRALGFQVVRWTWRDLYRFDVVAAEIARAGDGRKRA
ncbi:hypothetical protein [Rhodococcus artemisiae]|uniref:AbiEi antitoxin of type IV toxin-antitoxin system n=1 Tax=Rhodococcus artemisiae TaxID=714159 RepID=A0ABU7LFI3_9NOCA|nr:hypothetical protein [Rhodococcus artemisiae]MEE2060301.1 hypothetical protein [Rhodococcus artemisiae]